MVYHAHIATLCYNQVSTKKADGRMYYEYSARPNQLSKKATRNG